MFAVDARASRLTPQIEPNSFEQVSRSCAPLSPPGLSGLALLVHLTTMTAERTSELLSWRGQTGSEFCSSLHAGCNVLAPTRRRPGELSSVIARRQCKSRDRGKGNAFKRQSKSAQNQKLYTSWVQRLPKRATYSYHSLPPLLFLFSSSLSLFFPTSPSQLLQESTDDDGVVQSAHWRHFSEKRRPSYETVVTVY